MSAKDRHDGASDLDTDSGLETVPYTDVCEGLSLGCQLLNTGEWVIYLSKE